MPSDALRSSGGGWPALQSVSRAVGAKYVMTTAVANRPLSARLTNASFIDISSVRWSMWFM